MAPEAFTVGESVALLELLEELGAWAPQAAANSSAPLTANAAAALLKRRIVEVAMMLLS